MSENKFLTGEQVEDAVCKLFDRACAGDQAECDTLIKVIIDTDAVLRVRITALEGWIQFLKQDDNDDGTYESDGEHCVDFYRNCDMALEGKSVPQALATGQD